MGFKKKKGYLKYLQEQTEYFLELRNESEKYDELYKELMNRLQSDINLVKEKIAKQYTYTAVLCFIGIGLVSANDINITIAFLRFSELDFLKIIFPIVLAYHGLKIVNLMEHKFQKLMRLDAMQDGYYNIRGFHMRLRPFQSYSLHDQMVELHESDYFKPRRKFAMLNYGLYAQMMFFAYVGVIAYMYLTMKDEFIGEENFILGISSITLLAISFGISIYLFFLMFSKFMPWITKIEGDTEFTLGEEVIAKDES